MYKKSHYALLALFFVSSGMQAMQQEGRGSTSVEKLKKVIAFNETKSLATGNKGGITTPLKLMLAAGQVTYASTVGGGILGYPMGFPNEIGMISGGTCAYALMYNQISNQRKILVTIGSAFGYTGGVMSNALIWGLDSQSGTENN